MKNTLWMAAIAATILVAGSGCKKAHEPAPEYLADCNVFIKTTPGEEMIILAKSEAFASYYIDRAYNLRVDFEAEYGEGNVEWNNSVIRRPQLDALPDLYEITITVDVNCLGLHPPVQKTDGNIRIVKYYYWAFFESEVDEFVSRIPQHWYYNDNGVIDKDVKIISTTKENLGPEFQNRKITF